MNTANISNHAANLVAAALSPEVPDERTYVDTRDSTILPQALVYVEGAGASGSVMYSGTLVVHVWGRSFYTASMLADRIPGALVDDHTLGDDRVYRVLRGGMTYLREPDAAHFTWRFPLRYDAPA